MSDIVTVVKRLTESALASGEISLSEAERQRLGIADHSLEIALAVGGGEFVEAVWSGRQRRLGGEALAEHLADYAQIGSIIRLERRGAELSLAVEAPGSSLDGWVAPVAAAETPQVARKPAPRRRVSSARLRLATRADYEIRDGVGFHRAAAQRARTALAKNQWSDAAAVATRQEAERLATLPQFDELLALDVANVDYMPHQEAAARTVLSRMGGRGVLADEVGLGKTVEAGLVVKELVLRGMAERVLVLCPAALRTQWQEELRTKFDEDFVVCTSGQNLRPDRQDRLIITQQLAMANESLLTRNPFDLVIVDEAHRLAGAGARRTREVIGAIVAAAPRVLFLTATPVQNDLSELYRLVELLRPGTFGSHAEFRRQYVAYDDPRRPVRADELRKLVSAAMVRTTRTQAGLDKVKRLPPHDIGIRLSPPEREIYDLCLHTLRDVMRRDGDAQRRRTLALKLTASPYALSRSALRMAETHPDSEVRSLLTEIGHGANKLEATSRELALLEQVQQWHKEHGRVLIFSQHTQTVTGLLRALDRAGLQAVPFHGGMSSGARRDSIEAFTEGRAPILVSTDAGAEGVNLQASNCVINYDLPWNPMRVEQRIGRVHRLTQTRDVHIANLFALDTVDEDVYRLLHDKLAMFELLFGQVVTVLGELDQRDGGATFEGRVLDALLSGTDTEMAKRIRTLGDELQKARASANSVMSFDNDLSTWMSGRQAERLARRSAPEATELRPKTKKQDRARQRSVQRLVTTYLQAVGAEVIHKRQGYLSVSLTDELAERFGCASLHLAFDRAALDMHPDAELCAVGSEVFEILLEEIRQDAVVTGTLPALPDDSSLPTLPHHPSVSLVKRRVRMKDDWATRGTFRVRFGDIDGDYELISVECGTQPEPSRARRALSAETFPPAGYGRRVLDTLSQAAADTLQGRIADHDRRRRESGQRQQAALIANLDAQIDDLAQRLKFAWTKLPEDERQLENLRRARTTIAAASSHSGTEALAELLTFEMHNVGDIRVVETWRHVGGAEYEHEYLWPDGDRRVRAVSTGRPLDIFSLCRDGHPCDPAELVACELCAGDTCVACTDERVVACCPLCGSRACGDCRAADGLCAACQQAVRRPEFDTKWERAWELPSATRLLVGARHTYVQRGDGVVELLVPDTDVADPARQRVRSLAARLNLPPGAGLLAAGEHAIGGLDSALWSSVIDEGAWFDVVEHAVTDVDAFGLSAIPELPGNPVGSEVERSVGSLLQQLRSECPPPTPAIRVHPVARLDRIDVDVDVDVDVDGAGLRRRCLWIDDEGEIEADSVVVPFNVASGPTSDGRRLVASADGPGFSCRVEGLHRSYVVTLQVAEDVKQWFLSHTDARTASGESAWTQLIRQYGLPAQVVLSRAAAGAPQTPTFATADDGVTVERSMRTALIITDEVGAAVDDSDLALLPEGATRPSLELPSHDALRVLLPVLDSVDEIEPCSLVPHLLIDETWRRGTHHVERSYVVGPSCAEGRQHVSSNAPAYPSVDGSDSTAVVVGLDDRGHLSSPGEISLCPQCGCSSCEACGPEGVIAPCAGCDHLACGKCRSGEHSLASFTCAHCGDHSCHDCGRKVPGADCLVCRRPVCSQCQTDLICVTCESLAPASATTIGSLPRDLAARGMHVWSAEDSDCLVAIIVGGGRREVAVVRQGQVAMWSSFGSLAPAQIRLAIALQKTGKFAAPVEVRTGVRDRADAATGHVLSDSETAAVSWSLQMPAAEPHRGRADFDPDADTSDEALVRTVAAELDVHVDLSGPVPFPMAATSSLATKLNAYATTQETAVLSIDVERQRETLVVGVRGLEWSRRGAITASLLDPWRPSESPQWLRDVWRPEPAVLVAALRGWEVALAGVGAHVLLAVRQEQQETWLSVQEAPADLRRAMLGPYLGISDLVSVRKLTRPRDLVAPAVVGGTLSDRKIVPLVVPDDGDEGAEVDLDALLAEWRTTATAPDTTGVIESALARQLAQALHSAFPFTRQAVGVGLRVDETWQWSGREVALSYDVAPGDRDGLVPCPDTGGAASLVWVCASGHLAARLVACHTCKKETCGSCSDVAQACGICGVAQCPACAASYGGPSTRCRACALLRKLGFLERRKALRGVERPDMAWQGEHNGVRVQCLLYQDAWTVVRYEPSGVFRIPMDAGRLSQIQSQCAGK